MFKKKKGIKLPYNKQGLVYFSCMSTKDMSESDTEKLKTLCSETAGEYADALYEFVTDDKFNAEGVAQRHHMSTSLLYALRRKFYSRVASKIKISIETENS